jgi:hypothetical protein
VTSAGGAEVAARAPFEACIRTSEGETRRELAEVPLDLLRRCSPIRRPAVYRRQDHMPGRWFSTTARRFLDYESLLERDWMLMMDFDREVEGICEQPLRLHYIREGRTASHVPDLLVWRRGLPELCDIKSEERLEGRIFEAQVEATQTACAGAGLGYRVLSEPGPQLLANVRWFAGFRTPPADPDGERDQMLSVLSIGPSTIAELMALSSEPALARPVLMHLLWGGEAEADLHEPLGEESHVRLGACS